MKKFKFTLSEVLNIEMSKKNELMNSLAVINNDIKYMETERTEMEITLDMEKNKLNESDRCMKISMVNEHLRYIDSILRCIDICNENICEMKKRSKQITEEVLSCSRKIEVLNKIKEKQEKDFHAELKKEEESFIQEIIETRYSHKKGNKII